MKTVDKILERVAEDFPDTSIRQISKSLGISVATVRKHIEYLQDTMMIEKAEGMNGKEDRYFLSKTSHLLLAMVRDMRMGG